jgi:hypothetical protein
MTPAELEIAGRLLYGARWQTSLARNVGVTNRSVRRWYAGTRKMKPESEEKIKILMARHANYIRVILASLEPEKTGKVPTIRT